MDMGPHTLVIKRGEYGAILFPADGHFIVPGYLLEDVFDPTGAGDCFAGGFMGYLARAGRRPAARRDRSPGAAPRRHLRVGDGQLLLRKVRRRTAFARSRARKSMPATASSKPSRISEPRSTSRRKCSRWPVVLVAFAAGAAERRRGVACWRAGWTLYYGDAEAHLNIARRIIDSRTPGYGADWHGVAAAAAPADAAIRDAR